jgi:hypothetical protein
MAILQLSDAYTSQRFCQNGRKMRTIVLLLSLLSGTLLLHAQQTWNGLRFGMTEAEAKLALQGKMIPMGPKDQPEEPRDFYYGGHVDGLELEGLHGDAALRFNKKSKRLVFVSLLFTTKNPEEEQSPTVGRIRDDFVKKYGSPTLSRGFGPEGCDERISDKCVLIFHGAGQTITVTFLVYTSHEVVSTSFVGVEVYYEPLGAKSAI